MGRDAVKWLEQVEPHFGFLSEHGFNRVTTDGSSFWSHWVRYASAVAAIQITKSNEFARVEISLIRLVDGEVPPYPIWITSDPVNHALLDTLIEARDPARLQELTEKGGLGPRDIDRQLAHWAAVLREVAPDFLAGDLSAIDETEALVRGRVAGHPQQLTTWIPEDAPPTAEATEVAKMREHVPDNVTIDVRRYRRRNGH